MQGDGSRALKKAMMAGVSKTSCYRSLNNYQDIMSCYSVDLNTHTAQKPFCNQPGPVEKSLGRRTTSRVSVGSSVAPILLQYYPNITLILPQFGTLIPFRQDCQDVLT